MGRPANDGIIPARAGFTVLDALSCEDSSDHPRSRGVYSLFSHYFESGLGSSPLARGLRSTRMRSRSPRRIIPARAGFTVLDALSCEDSSDHPRSRGVYGLRSKRFRPVSGSSPLARGLLGERAALGPVQGIIPARAGFTQTP